VAELISFMDGQGKIEDDATLIALSTELKPESSSSTDSVQQKDYSLLELIEFVEVIEAEYLPAEPINPERRRGLPTDL